MQPLFDAGGQPLYLYRISGYEEVTWAVSSKKFTQIEFHKRLLQELVSMFPVIDSLNKESLELFGVEWHSSDERYPKHIDPDNLTKGTVEQYNEFYDKWNATIPFDPLEAALKGIGCEILGATASAFCSHCCATAYQCAAHIKGDLRELLAKDQSLEVS